MTDATTARAALLREPNFRWMMSGGLISSLGDQFTMIALPWLVLTLTGSPLTMGVVIALMSIPRALLILVGGALVDRHSPKTILMLSKFGNGALLFALAAMVLTDKVSMPVVYVLAVGLGISSAFSIPSGTSMLPHVVAPAQVQMANGVSMGIRQLTMLAGPLLAALVFAVFGDGSGTGPGAARGIGIAFALDCFSFLFSAWTLSRVRLLHAPPRAAPEPMFRAIGAGLSMVWHDGALRVCMLYWGLGALGVGGTMQVALPGEALRLSLVQHTWQAGAIMILMGLLAGFLQVAVFTWIQQRVPRPMLGRAMSIFMFIFMGVAPLAAAVTGWLLQWASLTQLFTGAGSFVLVAVALAWLFTPMARVSDAAIER